MKEVETMGLILCVLLFFSGYLCILRQMARKAERLSVAAAVIFLFLYAIFCGIFCLVIQKGMGENMVLPAVLLCLVFLMGISAFRWLIGNLRQMNALVLVLLVGYLGVMGYITVFSREAKSGLDIQLNVNAVRDMLKTGSLSSMKHFLQNVAMFMPLGLLLPLTEPKEGLHFVQVLAAALFLTAGIESVQLILSMGQVDIGDLVANTLGAMAGFAVCKAIFQNKLAK